MSSNRQVFAEHYPPGQWYHPRALEMGVNPNAPLTVEIEFLNQGTASAAIWETLKICGLEIYRGIIVAPRMDDDEDDD